MNDGECPKCKGELSYEDNRYESGHDTHEYHEYVYCVDCKAQFVNIYTLTAQEEADE
jgi:uncharacterized protein YbaR (Trm112 family)